MKRTVKFNEKIALEVFTILNDFYQRGVGIFNEKNLPQNRWPPIDAKPLSDKELTDFFFYAALTMRGGIISDDPFRWLWNLREKHPALFDPALVVKKWTPEKIRERLVAAGMSYKGLEIPRFWYKNSVNLCKWWGGDLRNVFKYGVLEFEEAFRRIDYERSTIGFYGMRRKIFSLLTIWLQEKNLIPVFPTPIPVDFHAMRVLWATEILDTNKWARPFTPNEKHPEQLAGKTTMRVWYSLPDQIAIWSQKFLQKTNIPHMTINPALWILSRSLCSGQLQNLTKKDGTVYVETEKLRKNHNLWPPSYQDPCHICPVEKWCKWCIPSAPYYNWGLLVRIGKRVPFPQQYLIGFENLNHKPRKKNRGADQA
ncbi:MAG: hypothetical protein Q8N59_01320 [bacterium]|nr:hypothetical protein [bacterium]